MSGTCELVGSTNNIWNDCYGKSKTLLAILAYPNIVSSRSIFNGFTEMNRYVECLLIDLLVYWL